MPPRVTWMARASVPVTDGSASSWYGMPSASAAATRRSNTTGLMFGPRAITGPAAADDLSVLRFVDARVVRGMGDVEGERHVRIHGMGACHGAAGADLLLQLVATAMKSPGARPARRQLLHARDRRSTRRTCHRSTSRRPCSSPNRSNPTPNVMGSPTRTSFFTRLGLHAQIDNEGGERRDRLALVRLDEVDGLAAHDAAEGAGSGVHVDPHAGQDGRVHAAQRGHGEEALVGDVGDHEADLVHMGRQHERGRTGVAALEYRAHRAHGVGGHFVGHIGEPLAHERRRRFLEARRRGSLHQLLQKFQVLLLHITNILSNACACARAWEGGSPAPAGRRWSSPASRRERRRRAPPSRLVHDTALAPNSSSIFMRASWALALVPARASLSNSNSPRSLS